VLLSSLLIAGCASTVDPDVADIDLITEVHPEFNLGNYGSYDWNINASLVYDPNGAWEPPAYDMDEEIRFLIDSELRGQGLIQSSNGPDLLASFAIAIQMDELPFNRDPNEAMPDIGEVQQGALVITLVDPDLGYAVWVGLAVADASTTPETAKSLKRLSYAVSGLLDTLPGQ
jgi:hypothetical protein